MDDPWEDIVPNWEIGDEDFFYQIQNQNGNKNDDNYCLDELEEWVRDVISEQPPPPAAASTPQSEGSFVGGVASSSAATCSNNNDNNNNNDIIIGGSIMISSSSLLLSPSSYILCFDNNNSNNDLKGTKKKKTRNNSHKEDHVIAERKRRLELTQTIIALSATIPGLTKTDKAYIIGEAVKYVKQLQERVRELENRNRVVGGADSSAILVKKTNDDACNGRIIIIEQLPEVEARVLEKQVLVRILCEKQSHNTLLQILSFLNTLHLSITSTTVLPLGTSIVQINIISQMDEEYNLTTDDLVETLQRFLLLNLKSQDMKP